MYDILGRMAASTKGRAAELKRTYLILETAVPAPEIAFLKVLTAPYLTSEQPTTKRAVTGQEGRVDAMVAREVRTNMRRERCQALYKQQSLNEYV